jgi:hypothetical protein
MPLFVPKLFETSHIDVSKIHSIQNSVSAPHRRLQSLLEHFLHCHCSSLEICVPRLSLGPKLRSLQKPHGIAAKRNTLAGKPAAGRGPA